MSEANKGKFWGIGYDDQGERQSDACDVDDAIGASRRGFGMIKLYEYDSSKRGKPGMVGKLKKVVLPIPKKTT